MLTKTKTANPDQLIELHSSNVKQLLNDRLTGKVIDWVFKNRVDQGKVAEFHWDLEDKALLQKIFSNPKAMGLDLPMQDAKFRRFVQSIIQNGLNSTDVELFQRFKHSLPLRSLGLVHDLRDFGFSKDGEVGRLEAKNTLQNGFYMLEICVDPRQFNARIQIETTANYTKPSDLEQFPLRAKSATVAKRLLWLKRDARVQMTISAPGSVPVSRKYLKDFRIVRLTRPFFLSRLYKKLGKSFDVKRAMHVTDVELLAQWQLYEQLFSRTALQTSSSSGHVLARASFKQKSSREKLQEILRLLAAKR